ncbi:MAG: ankyrin repeat domain-containing protein [Phycisphaerales bacterium]|nr:ankyrin repeat domain-containing protein [Phycisphaerales bacterium]MDP6891125.1 ankyrin repeat domain-containing protein [Phycisphaerales bacterium]
MMSIHTRTMACWATLLAVGTLLLGTPMSVGQDHPTDQPTSAPDPPKPAEKPTPAGPAGGALRPPANLPPQAGAPARVQVVTAAPPTIELGEFSTSETKAGQVTLKNNGDTPVTVISAKASCGCTTADFKKNTILQPGEETDVTVRMRGGPTARVLNKTLTFTIEGYPQLKVPVKGKSIAYVKMAPGRVGINDNPDGKVVFESIDEQPFKILNVQPAITGGELPKEAKTKHEVVLDWDKFLATGKNSRVTFYFDHPKASQHFTVVKLDADQRKQIRTNATADRPQRTKPGTKPGEGGKITTSGQPEQFGPQPPRVQSMASLVNSGRLADLKSRLEAGEKPGATDDGGSPLLALASKKGHVEMMTVLLDAGADINQTDRVGRTALMHAGTSKNPEAVRLLIERDADVNMRDSFIGGALAWTSGFGTAESVQDLLDAGAQVETVGSATGYTPLIWASGFGDPNAIPMLLEAGANIEATDGIDGSTPLMHACKTGQIEGLKTLLEKGAQLEARNRNGQTPLLAAASHANGTADKITLLLKQGADASATDNSKRTVLDLAKARTDANASQVLVILSELPELAAPADNG